MYQRLTVTLLVVLGLFRLTVAEAAVRGRDRRSDDTDPMNAVVSGLAEKVNQLTAQLTAQGTQIKDLTDRLSAAEQAVGFTVKYRSGVIEHLGRGQILKFDNVLYNAGSGYSTTTGLFTAPSAGTYAFYMNLAKHEDGGCTQINLMQGSTWLLTADACDHDLNTGSNMAVRHLAAGNTVHVQMNSGDKVHGDWHTSFFGMKLSPL